MCELCNGTRIVHVILSYGIQFSGCPACGPISTEEWLAKQAARKAWVAELKEAYGIQIKE